MRKGEVGEGRTRRGRRGQGNRGGRGTDSIPAPVKQVLRLLPAS